MANTSITTPRTCQEVGVCQRTSGKACRLACRLMVDTGYGAPMGYEAANPQAQAEPMQAQERLDAPEDLWTWLDGLMHKASRAACALGVVVLIVLTFVSSYLHLTAR